MNYIKFLKKILSEIAKNNFWQDKFNMIVILNSLILNISIWLFLAFRLKPSEYPVPLHFNIYFGIDVIDDWTSAFIIPIIGLIVVILNMVLSIVIYPREKFISHFLVSSSLFIQILLFLAAIGVVVIR